MIFISGCKYINVCMHMHVHACIHECAYMNGYISACTWVCMRTCVCACICACMYIFQYPPPYWSGLTGFAPPHIEKLPTPMLHVFHREKLHFWILGNHISSQHTIGLLGHHRPANETNILMVFRWRADSGPRRQNTRLGIGPGCTPTSLLSYRD